MTTTVEPMATAKPLWQYTITSPTARQWIGQGYESESAARRAAGVRKTQIKKAVQKP